MKKMQEANGGYVKINGEKYVISTESVAASSYGGITMAATIPGVDARQWYDMMDAMYGEGWEKYTGTPELFGLNNQEGVSRLERLGESVKWKAGGALGGAVKGKFFGLRLSSGLKFSETANGDLTGDVDPMMAFEASLIKFEVGKHDLGLSYEWQADLSTSPATTTEEPVVGYGRGPMSVSPWEVGVTVTPGIVEFGVSLDFQKVWEAIIGE